MNIDCKMLKIKNKRKICGKDSLNIKVNYLLKLNLIENFRDIIK
jgi:hypothetical protein